MIFHVSIKKKILATAPINKQATFSTILETHPYHLVPVNIMSKESYFRKNLNANPTLNTSILISQKFAIFWIPYGFPTDKFCAELPSKNVINNSPRCVEFVLRKSILLLIPYDNCCGTHKNKKSWWVSKESYFFRRHINQPKICDFLNTIWISNQQILRRVTVQKHY